MGNLPKDFNPDDHKGGEFDDIPAGEYEAMIIHSEKLKNSPTSKDPDGTHVSLHIQITKGEFKGRLLFENMNFENKNQTAVEIALATLASLSRATGVPKPTDSPDLHDRPMLVKVKYKKKKKENSDDPDEFQQNLSYYPRQEPGQSRQGDGTSPYGRGRKNRQASGTDDF